MTAPTPPPVKGGFRAHARKILWGLLAAVTTPEAIKAEKNLAVIVLTRAAILVPGAAGVVYVIVKALGG